MSALLLFLAVAGLYAFRFLESSSTLVREELDRIEVHRELARRSDSIVAELANDPTPRSDSPHDPVWQLLEKVNRSGFEARLSDRSAVPEETPFIDLEGEEVPAMVQLFLEHGVDVEAAHAAGALLARKRESGLQFSLPGLGSVLDGSFTGLRQLLSCEPMVNVNLAPPRRLASELLSEVASRDRALQTLDSIVALRASSEIDEAVLRRLYPEEACSRRRASRLGVRTWVWRLVVSNGSGRLTRTIVRLQTPPPLRHRVIADRYERLPSSTESNRRVAADDK